MSPSKKAAIHTRGPQSDHQPMLFHTLTVETALTHFATNTRGLAEKAVLERRQQFGTNQFSKEQRVSIFKKIINQLINPLALVLLVACVITLLLGEYLDSIVITLALLIAVVVGVLQEGKASSAFAKLSESQVKKATVLRDGSKHEVLAEDLVPGDIVILQNGDRVPADVRIITAKSLAINESPLTGEWKEIKKSIDPVAAQALLAEQTNMAWMGTFVADGYGVGVVVAIGDTTQVGQLASSIRNVKEVATPLQVEMKALSLKMIGIIAVLVVVIFTIGLLQGQPLHDMIIMSIAIAVASIPEGLPAAVTIILAVGMEALLKRGGLVRNLLAAETLGSTTYVLTDKTGTLTEAKMSVAGLLVDDGMYVELPQLGTFAPAERFFDIALAAADAYRDDVGEETVLRGDSVERAVLSTAYSLGISDTRDSLRAQRIDYLPFTSEQRFAAGLVPNKDGTNLLCINGAPTTLLKHANKCLTTKGDEAVFSSAMRDDYTSAITRLTNTGKRLIAVGYKTVQYSDIPESDPTVIDDLVFCGVIVLDDPLREGVGEAILGVQSAGARVLLITGDNPQTALSIARSVGITDATGVALTGKDIEVLSDEELYKAATEVSVFARVLPNQKMRIAIVLQKYGEIVAMTGDGINDAPALRRANIGIAIGSGTAVAKEASDLVLVKDSFTTIYAAIEEGRRVVSNLRKIVGYLLSTSLSEVVLITTALMIGAAVPILPAQILWANIIEEGLMSVAFAFEKGSKNAMKRKPRDIHAEGLVSKQMFWFIAFAVFVLSVLNVALYFYLRSLQLPIEDLRSLIFLGVAMDSLFMSFAFRSLSTPVWKIPLNTNWFFIASFFISAALFALALTVPFFQYLLSYNPQPFNLLVLPIIASALSLLAIEVGKWLFFERRS